MTNCFPLPGVVGQGRSKMLLDKALNRLVMVRI